jgi:hypothetical protein
VPADEQEYFRKRIAKRIEARNGFIGHATSYVLVNLLLWGIFAGSGGFEGFLSASGEFPWPMLVMFFWFAGLGAHAVETYFSTGERAARKDRAVRDALRQQYGSGWYNTASKKQMKTVRERVTKASAKVQDFFEHAAAYVGVNGGLWTIWFLASFRESNFEFPWPAFVTLGWGIGLFFSAMEAFGARNAEQSIEREIERELQRELLEDEKPKRKNDNIRLTEDGELTDSMVAEMEAEERKIKVRR